MSALNPIGTPFVELPTLESTNNYAMGLARAGMAHHGTVVFTHEQTRGKGQRGKIWTSEKGSNIAMSVVLEPEELNVGEVFALSKMTSVAVQAFCSRYLGGEVKIKWPNDIYWGDRKAAGILIENIWQGDTWKYAVAGIGININQTDFGALGSTAVSWRQITGRQFEPALLARELCTFLQSSYRLLVADPGLLTQHYTTHLYRLNETVRLKKETRIFDALFTGIADDGRMMVRHGVEEQFAVGEVEWIREG